MFTDPGATQAERRYSVVVESGFARQAAHEILKARLWRDRYWILLFYPVALCPLLGWWWRAEPIHVAAYTAVTLAIWVPIFWLLLTRTMAVKIREAMPEGSTLDTIFTATELTIAIPAMSSTQRLRGLRHVRDLGTVVVFDCAVGRGVQAVPKAAFPDSEILRVTP